MKDTKDVVACVVDFGMFIHVARRLGRDLKKVYYTTEPDESFPHIGRWCIGDGYPEIEWVESVKEVADKIDLAVYTDIGRAYDQADLEARGIAVWGSKHADGVESGRGLFLEELARTNLPVPKHEIIKGITNLRLYLKDKENVFIKASTFRGDIETCRFRSMVEDCGIIDGWAVALGPFQEKLKFYVFEEIETRIEGGCDTWRTGGQWPNIVMNGFESKDKSYLMTFCNWQDLPDEIRVVNEEFGPILDKYKYAGPFSTEVRVTDDNQSFFLDPTCRYASPVSQAQCDMIDNFGEVVWKGANGICVDPVYEEENQFGVQALITVNRSGWNVYDIPAEIEPYVKISESSVVDKNIVLCPDDEATGAIAWLTATGSTIEYAIHNLKAYAEQLPCGIEVRIDSLVGLLEEAKEAEDMGMKFSDSIPEPEIVTE